jgi:peroxiredoxin
MPTLTAGKTAPPFELADTSGAKHALREALAKGPVLAAFFKVNCPTCQYTFPFLERLYTQFRAQGVQVWGIVQNAAADGKDFATEYGITFPILVDDRPYTISRAYGLKYVPTVFLIEHDAQVTRSSEGFVKADLLGIQKALAQSLATSPAALFLPKERIPEYRPG